VQRARRGGFSVLLHASSDDLRNFVVAEAQPTSRNTLAPDTPR
jgi:hypothetical protein